MTTRWRATSGLPTRYYVDGKFAWRNAKKPKQILDDIAEDRGSMSVYSVVSILNHSTYKNQLDAQSTRIASSGLAKKLRKGSYEMKSLLQH